MTQLVNLTPHSISLRTVLSNAVVETVIPPSGQVARVSTVPGNIVRDIPDLEALPVPVYSAPQWGPVEGLPEPVPGVVYIVSALVASRCSHRPDVVSPGTGPADGAVRDDQGRIVAVTCLICASQWL